jgi:hypothetical protein
MEKHDEPIPEITLNIKRVQVEGEPKKLKARWSPNPIEQAKSGPKVVETVVETWRTGDNISAPYEVKILHVERMEDDYWPYADLGYHYNSFSIDANNNRTALPVKCIGYLSLENMRRFAQEHTLRNKQWEQIPNKGKENA